MSFRGTSETLSTRVQKSPVLSSRNQTSARAKTAMSTPRTIRIKTKTAGQVFFQQKFQNFDATRSNNKD